jgi:hypothetical protein
MFTLLVIDYLLAAELRVPKLKLVSIAADLTMFKLLAMPTLQAFFTPAEHPLLFTFILAKYILSSVAMLDTLAAIMLGRGLADILPVPVWLRSIVLHAQSSDDDEHSMFASSSSSHMNSRKSVRLPLPIERLPSSYTPTPAPENSEGGACRICWENIPDVFIAACHHRTCATCFQALREPKCPLCRTEVDKGLFIYS